MSAIDQPSEISEASLIDRCEEEGVVFDFDGSIKWSCGWHYGPGPGKSFASPKEAAEEAVRVLGLHIVPY